MRGRPKNSFSNLSKRSKYRRVAELRTCELERLLLASAQAAKKNGEKDLEHVMRLLQKGRNEVATKIRRLLDAGNCLIKPQKLHPLRALTYIFDNRLSFAQYVNTRFICKDAGFDIFPVYNQIVQAKLECRPPRECLKINDVCASLPLQALLNHIAYRLLLLQEDVIIQLASKVSTNELEVKLRSKWGFDGTSQQPQYNQKFDNVDSAVQKSDANLFATTIVPLRMTLVKHANIIVWNNPMPQSTRWCRPLRLQFAKENPELTLHEKQSVEDEIKALKPFNVTIAGINVSITYELYLTMIDGKVLTVITETKSSQRCSICKALPKEFNNLKNIATRFKPQKDALNYGLSVLHLWIRSFEWLLHISYRLSVKKWQMRGTILKNLMKKRKEELQARFFEKLSLRVDFPNSGGGGNTNNGPVARAAFSKPEVLAEVLELDENLIKRVSTILIALSCQLQLDVDLFATFCEETAHFYVSLYEWFPMPPSIHKALIHSRDIMLANDLPLGILAEDAAESCNKLYRHNRQFHARKHNRISNLTDVFNRALDSSDPIVASFGQQKRQNSRHRKCIPVDVLRMLKAPEVQASEMDKISEEIEVDLDVVLREVSESLEGLCLPEDPFYNEHC